ncbi:MAG: DUF1553 domain-containing protein [Planctomycetota bacterium]|nr:MAG: DUF1553 domain-containing protein [Planctomycetota bacterium]
MLCTIVLGPASAAEPRRSDDVFATVAAIFERHCVSCHNDVDRKGDLSLRTPKDLRESGYVDPEDPDASVLLEAVRAEPGKRPAMPKTGTPLSAREVAAVRRWIAAGAPWPEGRQLRSKQELARDWWSLRPLTRPRIPQLDAVGRRDRVRNPIDRFVVRRLIEHDLPQSPPADRRTLVRRLYFDLLGLPPTPEEIRDFLSDQHPLAYERLVDRLLASPHYGERWGRHWLDVVKYADTCGYDKDKLRPNAWPYRDYVIRSLNEDKPYARFVQEQIAGDVLYPGEPDGILGLGFIAAGPWDFIGHVEVPESKFDGMVARHLDRDDMVCNVFNTFCSLTVQCARCHDHKFDPITQREYYGLQAVFAAVDRADRPYDVDPAVEQQRRKLLEEQQRLLAERSRLAEEIEQAAGPRRAELKDRLVRLLPRAEPASKRPEYGYHSGIERTADRVKWVQIDLQRTVRLSAIVLHPCHDEFNGIGAGFGFPVRYRIDVAGALPDGKPAAFRTLVDRTGSDTANPGLVPQRFVLSDVAARFVRITATRLAPRKNDFIFALAEVELLDDRGANVARGKPVTALDSIEAPVRWAKANLTDGIWPRPADEAAARELLAVRRELDAIERQALTPRRRRREQALENRLAEIDRALKRLPAGRLVYAAATHFRPRGNFRPTEGRPRPVFVLRRGNLRERLEPARPGALALIPGVPAAFDLPPEHSEGDRRAALARWIIDRRNPLTWRSIANRVWQYHFGRGLVDTPNDFGHMGGRPTHPELLDWLACELRDTQSLKHLHRLILTSATFRQAVQHDPEAARRDADNRLLWRANRRRLEAEEIRDAMLAVSGRLNLAMGGPGYFLFVLEKPEHSPHYEYHKFDPRDPKSHRRTIYRFVVRSQPDPYMTVLDCADSSQSTPKRNETLTALQALTLLNNRFNLLMAEYFAQRLNADAEPVLLAPELRRRIETMTADRRTAALRVARGFELTTGRGPAWQELTVLTDFTVRNGMPNLCRLLFNLSEFAYVE